MSHTPLKTFIIYAHADHKFYTELRSHLKPLERQGLLTVWDDAHIMPGEEWKKSIETHLDESDLVLMLVSATSLSSDFIHNTELKKAIAQEKRGSSQFVPILVSHCLWEEMPDLSAVQMLPLDPQRKLLAVTAWPNHDDAWTATLRELRNSIPNIQQKIVAARDAQEAALRAAQEAKKREEAAEKAEKKRHRLDEAAWIKVIGTVALEQNLVEKKEIYTTYLEDEETHRNHREEAEDAIDDLNGQIQFDRRLEANKTNRAEKNLIKTVIESAVSAGMAYIKGGTFEMGDVMEDKEFSDEVVHTVSIKDFYLGMNPVTFEEYDRYCELNGREKPDDHGWGRGKHPVINVNWYDAVEYCNWLSRQRDLKQVYTIDKSRLDVNNTSSKDNLKWTVIADWSANGYRLPSEAEWEYAARALNGKGGSIVRFGNGKDIASPTEINFNTRDKFVKPYSKAGESPQNTLTIGSLPSNSLGLYDMSGNVWDWCWDWYGEYATTAQTNPRGADSGSVRVYRGGSLLSYPASIRCARRGFVTPDYSYEDLGFRLALAVKKW